MTKRILWANMIPFCFWLWSLSCSKPMDYQDVLEQELAKEERCDSLFYGIHFNMTTPGFQDHCMEMNRQKIFFQKGFSAELAIYFKKEFKYPVTFYFFPNLENYLIQEIAGTFHYDGWSSFNQEQSADTLILDLVRQMEEWYAGRKFVKVPQANELLGYKYIKIDGNRMITLEKKLDTRYVYARFEDLKPIL